MADLYNDGQSARARAKSPSRRKARSGQRRRILTAARNRHRCVEYGVMQSLANITSSTSRVGRILVVEDSETQASKMPSLLEAQGWEASVAGSAEAVPASLAEPFPDLIIRLLHCSAVRLNQVLMNLTANVVDAMVGEGKIVITTDHTAEVFTISIRDAGTGIPESIRGKIFDLFFTTRPVGQGTGLGRAISTELYRTSVARSRFRAKKAWAPSSLQKSRWIWRRRGQNEGKAVSPGRPVADPQVAGESL